MVESVIPPTDRGGERNAAALLTHWIEPWRYGRRYRCTTPGDFGDDVVKR
jgi:hypothetical protein